MIIVLFVGSQTFAQVTIDYWDPHPRYKNLPTWFVNHVWRPIFWRSNVSQVDR